jgi:hypothetical protein
MEFVKVEKTAQTAVLTVVHADQLVEMGFVNLARTVATAV